MNEKLELRLYGLVPYQLTGIQQAIQYGHALQEYNNEIMEIIEDAASGRLVLPDDRREMYKFEQWRKEDKTFIILNGGTTNTNLDHLGTLNEHRLTLREHGIKIADFYEPDLGDQLTAVVFLVDDRVFDREKWPNYVGPTYIDGTPSEGDYWDWKMKFDEDEKEADRIVFLRDYLSKFKLA